MAREGCRPRIASMLPTVMLFVAALQLQVACEGRNLSGRQTATLEEQVPEQRLQRKATVMMQTGTVFQSAPGLVGTHRPKPDERTHPHSEGRQAKEVLNMDMPMPRIPDPFFGLEDAFDKENTVEAAALRAASAPTVSAEWLSLLSTIFIDAIMGGFGAATFLFLRSYLWGRPKDATPPAEEKKPKLRKAALAANAPATATHRVATAPAAAAAPAGDEWGCSALHLAAAAGDREEAKVLLQQNVDVDARDAWEETPLHFAARAGHVELCKLLLSNGAEIDATGLGGETALVVAAKSSQEAICQLLLLHGAGCAGLREDELPELLVKMIVARLLPQQD